MLFEIVECFLIQESFYWVTYCRCVCQSFLSLISFCCVVSRIEKLYDDDTRKEIYPMFVFTVHYELTEKNYWWKSFWWYLVVTQPASLWRYFTVLTLRQRPN